MRLAVNLAVFSGISFSVFNDKDMREVMRLTKKGNCDNSTSEINAENVVAAIEELAMQKRIEITNLLCNKIVNLTADMATCEARSFIGE